MTDCAFAAIASVADEFQKSLLTADADCSYDNLIEIDLDTVCFSPSSAYNWPCISTAVWATVAECMDGLGAELASPLQFSYTCVFYRILVNCLRLVFLMKQMSNLIICLTHTLFMVYRQL